MRNTWQKLYTDIQKRLGTIPTATPIKTTTASPIPIKPTTPAIVRTVPITITLSDLTTAQLKSLERMQQVPTRVAEVRVELLSEVLDAALNFLQGADVNHYFAVPVCTLLYLYIHI